MKHGYAAERIDGRWVWTEATHDEDGTFCHAPGATWKIRPNGIFFFTLREVEVFCARENG